jgi:hypothetical protein
MSLRDQFAPDWDVFANPDEFGSVREFRVSDGHGGFKVFTAEIVWDEDRAKTHPIATRFGVYVGEVMLFIRSRDLSRRPIAGELLYSPANQPWEVITSTDVEAGYEVALSMTRSQPAYYGGN